jgi:pimeloyl-ACP methyl ester carboxylesterase
MSTTKFFQSTSGKIAYTDTGGDGQALIFMHGLPTSKEIWKPVLPYLPQGWRAITFDLLDYGESGKANRLVSHVERADTLDELRAHLGLDKFILVAHDLGSSVAIDYMGKCAPRVEKLILMSPPVYPDFKEPFIVKLVRVQGLGEALVRLLKPVLLKAGILQGMIHKKRLTSDLFNGIAKGFEGNSGNAALLRVLRWGRPFNVFKTYPAIIASIRVPTLVLQGRRDPYITEDQVTRLRDTIPACKLVFIENGAHFLPMDTPVEIGREISQFVSQQ